MTYHKKNIKITIEYHEVSSNPWNKNSDIPSCQSFYSQFTQKKNHDFVVFTITLPEWFVECYLTWKQESWVVHHEKIYIFW